jgi:hypothetical protein
MRSARTLLAESQIDEAIELSGKEGIAKLLTGAAADSLASHLDSELGASVTDHAIYKAHTTKYCLNLLKDFDIRFILFTYWLGTLTSNKTLENPYICFAHGTTPLTLHACIAIIAV